jgi:polar amino acid transport system substrate-binding protein
MTQPTPSRLDQIRERGAVRIGVRWAASAEQYIDPDTGEPSGIVGLLGRLLARDLGVKAEFVDLLWADHLPALLDDRIDICMKHTNTPERALIVEFSTGRVLRYEGKIVIRRDGPIRREADLGQAATVIGCGRGDSQEEQIRARYPQAQIRYYAKTELVLAAVANGDVDACLADQSVPLFLKLNPGCTVVTHEDGSPVITSIDYSHPTVKPGDQRFLNWLNNWMDFHTVQGTIERIKEQAYVAFDAKFDRIMGMPQSEAQSAAQTAAQSAAPAAV